MKQTAFTLIELLVVIAIIAILAAILFPVFSQAKAQAKQTACLSNVKQLSLGVTMYLNDNDDAYPIGGWQVPDGVLNPTAYSRWYRDVAPYTKNTQIRNCPASQYPVDATNNWGSDYGINVSVSNWESALKASIVVKPANLLLDCDTAQLNWNTLVSSSDNLDPTKWAKYAVAVTDYQVTGPYEFFSDGSGIYPYTQTPYQYGDNYRRPYAIHNGNRANVGCCDGHAHSWEIDALIGPMPTGYALSDSRNVWANQ